MKVLGTDAPVHVSPGDLVVVGVASPLITPLMTLMGAVTERGRRDTKT